MMADEEVIHFVIVGHVDHGKSTLIGRLFYDTDSLPKEKILELKQASEELGREMEFAFLMDHLREERDQGITIDTAQAFFKTDQRKYVIIDTPGHVEFVKNMITGTSQAEAALLIVDAEEGIQEQTKRHSYILSLLGLEQVIVVINKMDLVGYKQSRYKKIKQNINEFLKSINIRPICHIPISASKGDNVAKKSMNMDWFTGSTILESLDSLKNKISSEKKPLLFPVQDVYKIGSKRVYVGKIEAGSVSVNQKIKILPEGQITHVKSIEKYREKPTKCLAGESIGITTQDPIFSDRGNILCTEKFEPTLTDKFKANLFWMSKKHLNTEEKIILKCATQEVYCKIEKIIKRMDSSTLEVIQENAQKLKNLEVGELIIKTDKPIALTSFKDVEELGRFVLVKNEDVCAGGIIIDTMDIL